MSKGARDVFALVFSFLNEKWQFQHIIVGLFEANETTWQAMARNLIKLLNQYDVNTTTYCAFLRREKQKTKRVCEAKTTCHICDVTRIATCGSPTIANI
jgi:hypothetical protein